MFDPKTYSFGVMPDGRRAESAIQKDRRQKALKMRDEGATFAAIAKELKVHSRTVQHWCAQAREVGAEAVIKGGRRGATVGDGRVLSPEQEREIVGLITTQLPGMQFRLWCVDALLELIRERFKMQISRGSVGNYLMRWGIGQQIPELPLYSDEVVRYIRSRAVKEKALMFWAGEMTPAFCSGPAGKLTDGDIPMLYALTSKGEIYFMFETVELRESRTLWTRFVEELGLMASERKARRKAFVLVPRSMESHEQLSAWEEGNARRPVYSTLVFFVLPG
jgi:transposase